MRRCRYFSARRRLARGILMLALAAASLAPTPAGAFDLRSELTDVSKTVDGRLGACIAIDAEAPTCINGAQRFPLQSVMKLFVGIAVMDAVDSRGWRLDTPIVVHRDDLSVCHQPIAALVTDAGYKTTIGDLLRRAIVDSDCAATDILIERLGGPKAVQDVLTRHGLGDVCIDRDEGHLQTEIAGLSWRREYSDPRVFDAAIAAVPKARRDAMYHAYQTDPRDTATPQGMIRLLQALSAGQLLSRESTHHLLEVMSTTATFPDRLKAALEPGWSLAHKTGTSGSWNGITAATNDVGIFTAPDGHRISVVAFLADSGATQDKRNGAIAVIGRLAIKSYRARTE